MNAVGVLDVVFGVNALYRHTVLGSDSSQGLSLFDDVSLVTDAF